MRRGIAAVLVALPGFVHCGSSRDYNEPDGGSAGSSGRAGAGSGGSAGKSGAGAGGRAGAGNGSGGSGNASEPGGSAGAAGDESGTVSAGGTGGPAGAGAGGEPDSGAGGDAAGMAGSGGTPPDPCAGEPCQNGGTCVVAGSNFSCACPDAFIGPRCELPRFELLSEAASSARGLSGDGKVVVGSVRGVTEDVPARWTRETGFEPLESESEPIDGGWALAASTDGSVVVGRAVLGSGGGAFRWTESDGLVPLELGADSTADDVTANGKTIVGTMNGNSDAHLYRWTSATGVQDLRTLGVGGTAVAADAAGTIIVGSYRVDPESVLNTPYRWTASFFADIGTRPGSPYGVTADGITTLGSFSDDSTIFLFTATPVSNELSYPDIEVVSPYNPRMSADGGLIAGQSSDGIWLWDRDNGTRLLRDVLLSFGVDVGERHLFDVSAISDDGGVLVGTAYPVSSREPRGYIVRL